MVQIITHQGRKALLLESDDFMSEANTKEAIYTAIRARAEGINFILIITSLPLRAIPLSIRLMYADNLERINCFRCAIG